MNKIKRITSIIIVFAILVTGNFARHFAFPGESDFSEAKILVKEDPRIDYLEDEKNACMPIKYYHNYKKMHEVLNSMNKLRKKDNLPKLTIDRDLENYALQLAGEGLAGQFMTYTKDHFYAQDTKDLITKDPDYICVFNARTSDRSTFVVDDIINKNGYYKNFKSLSNWIYFGDLEDYGSVFNRMEGSNIKYYICYNNVGYLKIMYNRKMFDEGFSRNDLDEKIKYTREDFSDIFNKTRSKIRSNPNNPNNEKLKKKYAKIVQNVFNAALSDQDIKSIAIASPESGPNIILFSTNEPKKWNKSDKKDGRVSVCLKKVAMFNKELPYDKLVEEYYDKKNQTLYFNKYQEKLIIDRSVLPTPRVSPVFLDIDGAIYQWGTEYDIVNADYGDYSFNLMSSHSYKLINDYSIVSYDCDPKIEITEMIIDEDYRPPYTPLPEIEVKKTDYDKYVKFDKKTNTFTMINNSLPSNYDILRISYKISFENGLSYETGVSLHDFQTKIVASYPSVKNGKVEYTQKNISNKEIEKLYENTHNLYDLYF